MGVRLYSNIVWFFHNGPISCYPVKAMADAGKAVADGARASAVSWPVLAELRAAMACIDHWGYLDWLLLKYYCIFRLRGTQNALSLDKHSQVYDAVAHAVSSFWRGQTVYQETHASWWCVKRRLGYLTSCGLPGVLVWGGSRLFADACSAFTTFLPVISIIRIYFGTSTWTTRVCGGDKTWTRGRQRSKACQGQKKLWSPSPLQFYSTENLSADNTMLEAELKLPSYQCVAPPCFLLCNYFPRVGASVSKVSTVGSSG